MERILQFLDNLDDLYGMVCLLGEKLRGFMISLSRLAAMLAAAVAGSWLTYSHLPLGLAVCYLLAVTLLYRMVTAPVPQSA